MIGGRKYDPGSRIICYAPPNTSPKKRTRRCVSFFVARRSIRDALFSCPKNASHRETHFFSPLNGKLPSSSLSVLVLAVPHMTKYKAQSLNRLTRKSMPPICSVRSVVKGCMSLYYEVVVINDPLQGHVLHWKGCCGLVCVSYRKTVHERLRPQPLAVLLIS